MRSALLLELGLTDYVEAWEIQRALAAAVTRGALPDTLVFVEHPPTVTMGRRTDPDELHLPADAEVAVVASDRGGRSTYHAPGQLVCYPILDLHRHGKDVRRYCRMLEETVIETLGSFEIAAVRIDGLTGVWIQSGAAPRKIASIGVHISRWVTTHGFALNVDLDPTPFSAWITACGLEAAAFTSMALELGRPLSTPEVQRTAAAVFAHTFALELDAFPEASLELLLAAARHDAAPAAA